LAAPRSVASTCLYESQKEGKLRARPLSLRAKLKTAGKAYVSGLCLRLRARPSEPQLSNIKAVNMVTLAAGEKHDAACKITGFMGRDVYSLGQGHRHFRREEAKSYSKATDILDWRTQTPGLWPGKPQARPQGPRGYIGLLQGH
jgi:hypothetical protein